MICFFEVMTYISGLSKLILTVISSIAPIVNIAANLQKEQGNVDILKVPTLDHDMWQTTVYINTLVKVFHTEIDYTYAFIDLLR